jgi:tetratricopeptide (TPR) repeat protein
MTSQAAAREAPRDRVLLEESRPFADSRLWRLQSAYFAERGIEAWRNAEVPHYVTSNPTMANAYAEIVLGFWRDRRRLEAVEAGGPMVVCELGGGSGRFAYHFLRRLERLCEDAGVSPQTFRYVLTDAVEANLSFWRAHPKFAPFFADGRLDVALLDLTEPDGLKLQVSGGTIAAGGLAQPPVFIANYVLDTIPQDLFHFKDQQGWACRAALAIDEDPRALAPGEGLERLQLLIDETPVDGSAYPEPRLQRLFERYRRELRDAHVLFPAPGLRALQRLSELSPRGALVLSADRGDHRLEALEGCAAPQPALHGSFSLPVNYDALAHYCEAGGGLALTCATHHSSIDIVGLMMLPDAAAHRLTHRAYRRHVEEFGPDSFYVLTKHFRDTLAEASAEHILALLRLSRYDAHQLARCLPRLAQLVPELDEGQRRDLAVAVEAAWDMYFPLGEDVDLANGLAALFYAMDDFPRALAFYERSRAIYGLDAGTLFNVAACHHMLDQHDDAIAALRRLLDVDGDNPAALGLLRACLDLVGEAADDGKSRQ